MPVVVEPAVVAVVAVVAVGVDTAVVSVPGLAGVSVPCVGFGVAGAAGEDGVVLAAFPPYGGKGPSPILQQSITTCIKNIYTYYLLHPITSFYESEKATCDFRLLPHCK